MPLVNPFVEAGRWYRACFHAHTTNSDGLMPPDSLVRHYRTAGFDILAITDHWRVTDASASSTADFLVLPGIEYNARGPEAGALRLFHIVGIGVQSPVEGANTPAAFVAAIHAQGGFAIVAHPSWSGLQGADLFTAAGADAVEVWNAGCELEVARGDSSAQWDIALSRGATLGGIAADDSHYPGFDSARAWVALHLEDLTPASVLDALRTRRYYASTGPSIQSVDANGDEVQVTCSAARQIHLVGPPPFGAGLVAGTMGLSHRAERARRGDGWAEGSGAEALTGGTFHLASHLSWFRLVVEDFSGRRAWTNPFWRTELGWSGFPVSADLPAT